MLRIVPIQQKSVSASPHMYQTKTSLCLQMSYQAATKKHMVLIMK